MSPPASRVFLSCCLGCLPVLGCVPSLREPLSLPELAGGGGIHAPEEVDALLGEADSLFARREVQSVSRAVTTWFAAAAADEHRTEGLVGAARGSVWLADHEAEARGRLQAATVAVQAAQLCLRAKPDSPACSFWLGASLGVQVRERASTAVSALPKIVEAFQRAAQADPLLEEAGPDRALALLYVRAPGWPAGPGDPDRGLEHARRAVDLRPDYPPNHLALGEALRATDDEAGSRGAYRRALDLAHARSAAGDKDAREWIEEADNALEGLRGGEA